MTSVSGIFDKPLASKPPRFTATVPCRLKKLITVSVENPVPLTVIVLPAWITEVTEICCPIGTETALLFWL